MLSPDGAIGVSPGYGDDALPAFGAEYVCACADAACARADDGDCGAYGADDGACCVCA